jgi:hypothetical protein
MAIGKDPGESTMIRVSYEVKEMIEAEKIIKREPLNDCIKRGILENRKYRTLNQSFETKESLKSDLENVTLNKSIPDPKITDKYHRKIWDDLHPDDPFKKGDVIHHINGNHNDDNPENLQKLTMSEHGQLPRRAEKYTMTQSSIIGKDQ